MKGYVKIIITFFIIYFILAIVLFGYAFYNRNLYQKIYNEGVILLESGYYEEAVKKFSEIPDYENYKDVEELLDTEETCPECGAVLD